MMKTLRNRGSRKIEMIRPLGLVTFTEPTVKPETSPEIRWDLVNRVKAEIAAGIYDTEEKWELAIDRLTARLSAD